jgi:hypothetical protein
MKIRRILAALCAGIVALSGLVALSSPASALPQGEARQSAPTAVPSCPSNYYCFYIRINWYYPGTTGWKIQFSSTTFGNFGTYYAAEGPTGSFLDNVESVANHTGKRICLYNNQRFLGSIAPRAELSTITAANNLADYWRATTASSCPAT